MRRGSGINKGTDPEQSAKRVQEGRQGRRMRVQKISGKDVHNMKARRGVQGVHGCLGGSRGGSGGVQRFWGDKNTKKLENAGMAQGTHFRCLSWPTPPHFQRC